MGKAELAAREQAHEKWSTQGAWEKGGFGGYRNRDFFKENPAVRERERKERRERIRERTPVCAWETSDRRDESAKTRPLR